MVVRISSVAMPAKMQDRRCTTAAYDSIAVKLIRGFPTEKHVLRRTDVGVGVRDAAIGAVLQHARGQDLQAGMV